MTKLTLALVAIAALTLACTPVGEGTPTPGPITISVNGTPITINELPVNVVVGGEQVLVGRVDAIAEAAPAGGRQAPRCELTVGGKGYFSEDVNYVLEGTRLWWGANNHVPTGSEVPIGTFALYIDDVRVDDWPKSEQGWVDLKSGTRYLKVDATGLGWTYRILPPREKIDGPRALKLVGTELERPAPRIVNGVLAGQCGSA